MAQNDDSADWHQRTRWHEYPIGLIGEMAHATLRTLIPFGVGIALTFTLTLIVGINFEEGNLRNLMLAAGMTEEGWKPVGNAIDDVTRMSILPLLVLSLAAGLLICIAMCVKDISISRALAAAARAEEPQDAVPPPAQVESVIKTRFTGLMIYSIFAGGSLAFVAIVVVIMSAVEGDDELLGAAFVMLGIAAAFGVLIWLMKKVWMPRHQKRRLVISEWWTTVHERRAWSAARGSEWKAEKKARKANSPAEIDRDTRVQRGSRLVIWSGLIFVLDVSLLYIVMRIQFPLAVSFNSGPRIDYPEVVDAVLNVVLLVVLAVALVALAGLLVGQIIHGRGRRAERAALREAIASPETLDVATPLIADYSKRGTVRLAGVLAALGAVFVVAGTTTLMLGGSDNGIYAGAASVFSQVALQAMIATIAGVILTVIAWFWNAYAARREAELRNLLMARWPRKPTMTTYLFSRQGESRKIPARIGPALTLGTERHG